MCQDPVQRAPLIRNRDARCTRAGEPRKGSVGRQGKAIQALFLASSLLILMWYPSQSGTHFEGGSVWSSAG
ncbi:hypothetical protein BDW71DRAFT_140373 [Aspergillus fruticulosus]